MLSVSVTVRKLSGSLVLVFGQLVVQIIFICMLIFGDIYWKKCVWNIRRVKDPSENMPANGGIFEHGGVKWFSSVLQ